MLLTLRLLTIITCIACLACGVFLIVAGIMEGDDPDAIWLGAGIAAYFLADLYLLYRSYKKKHAPTHWTAFILSVLPALIILIIVWIAGSISIG
jgi:peptidoglycan/LPS O-acetylase OafA/YrhL